MYQKLIKIADVADKTGHFELANDLTYLTKQAQFFQALRTIFDPQHSGLDSDSGLLERFIKGWGRGKGKGIELLMAINAELVKMNKDIVALIQPIKDFQTTVDSFYNKLISDTNPINASSVDTELRNLKDNLSQALRVVQERKLKNKLKLRDRLHRQYLRALDKVKNLSQEERDFLAKVVPNIEAHQAANNVQTENNQSATTQESVKQQAAQFKERESLPRFTTLEKTRAAGNWMKSQGVDDEVSPIEGAKLNRAKGWFSLFSDRWGLNPLAVEQFFKKNPRAYKELLSKFGRGVLDQLIHDLENTNDIGGFTNIYNDTQSNMPVEEAKEKQLEIQQQNNENKAKFQTNLNKKNKNDEELPRDAQIASKMLNVIKQKEQGQQNSRQLINNDKSKPISSNIEGNKSYEELLEDKRKYEEKNEALKRKRQEQESTASFNNKEQIIRLARIRKIKKLVNND